MLALTNPSAANRSIAACTMAARVVSAYSWYKRPGVTFVPILDLTPCSVSLAWWPQDTGLVAGLAAVADEVRARMAET